MYASPLTQQTNRSYSSSSVSSKGGAGPVKRFLILFGSETSVPSCLGVKGEDDGGISINTFPVRYFFKLACSCLGVKDEDDGGISINTFPVRYFFALAGVVGESVCWYDNR